MDSNQASSTSKPKKKVSAIIINVILVLAIVLAVVCAFTAFLAKNNQVPSIFGMKMFVIQTDSMSPTFNKGDLIISHDVDVTTLSAGTENEDDGDIITFWTIIQGETVLNTHRITAVNDYGNHLTFTTKGDNPLAEEDRLEVHQKDVVGKFSFAIPAVGNAINFLQTPLGFGIIIMLPVGVFFIWEIVNFFKALFAYQAEKVRVQFQQQMAAETKPAEEEKETESNDATPQE